MDFSQNLIALQVQKQACDKHDPEFYPKFKKWCDDYFLIKVLYSFNLYLEVLCYLL